MADINKLLGISNGKHKEFDLNSASNSVLINTLKIDAISEQTSDNGISIDSLAIKDGKLVTANSVVESNITDAAVTNAKLAGSIADGKLASDYIQTSEVDGSSIEFGSSLNVKASGITNDMLAGSIAFAKLSDNANIARLDQAESIAAVWGFGANIPTASANPSSDNQLARKAYVDSVAQGLDAKDSVRAATTANITLSAPQTIDGISIIADDRLLVKDQTDPIENGIYIVAAGAFVRSSDLAAGDHAASMYCFIEEGTINADNGFVCTSDSAADVVGTNSLAYSQFSGAGSVVAGDGLSKSGNELSVNVDDSSLEINSDTLRVKASGVTSDMLAGSIADGKLASNYIQTSEVDDSSIEFGASLNVKASGITNAMLAGSIADSKLSTISTASKVSGTALQLASNPGLEDSTGIKIKLNGTTLALGASGLAVNEILNANIAAAAAIVTSKLADATELAEAVTFFGSTDLSAADAEILSDGSIADSLHKHEKVFVTLTNNTGSQIDANSFICASQTVAGEIILADSDALATCEGFIGIASANIADAASGLIQVSGEASVTTDGTNFDLGKEVFISTTAGAGSKTAPSGTGDIVILGGIATAINKIIISREYRYEVA